MEISLHLPPSSWYHNSSDNDLAYWGLDYPPLSGYASWALGKIVQFVEPNAVRLHSSRGFESPLSRAAMRFTVLLSDLLVFFPGLVLASYSVYRSPASDHKFDTARTTELVPVVAFCATLPALILTDHGHFQYNGVSLGLFLFAMAFFILRKESLGAACFCLSIYFKQMGLYYGMAVFAFLVGRLWRILRGTGPTSAFVFVCKVISSILLVSVITFWPWLSEKELLVAVLKRLFPVSRGLFEDKVANVWCSISVLIKMKTLLEPEMLVKTCATCTVLTSLPFCAAVAVKPSPDRLLLSTSGCALAAYLLSFQVHEKQILLPLLPLCVLYGKHPLISFWTSIVACMSMFPLFQREGLLSAYWATLVIHFALVSSTCRFKGCSQTIYKLNALKFAFVIGVFLHLVLLVLTPPSNMPDIFVLLTTSYACAHFCIIYVYMVYSVWTDSSLITL